MSENRVIGTTAFGQKQIEVVVVPGRGKRQIGSYATVGESDRAGDAWLDRRQMRQLRDALNEALGA
jgi:hypothetical protein